MVRQMTEKEAERFCEERCKFLDYKDIQEYIEDIVVCRVYSVQFLALYGRRGEAAVRRADPPH